MHSPWSNLFSKHTAVSFDRQIHLATLVGQLDWRFDMSVGKLFFGDRFGWSAQLLGTQSEVTNTWLWAWANEASNIPSSLLGAAKMVRLYGEHNQIPELTTPQIECGEIDGHKLAMVARGLCRGNAYYRAPYEGGAAYLLIQDENFPRSQEPPLARLISLFPQAISAIEISDHRLALIGYLEYHGIWFEDNGRQIAVREKGEVVLTATFDELNRLTDMEARVETNSAG